MRDTTFYKKAGLQRKLDTKIAQQLDLGPGEIILICLINGGGKSSPRKIIPDVINYFLITTERIFIFSAKSYLKKTTFPRSAEIVYEINLKSVIKIIEIIKVNVVMKHSPKQQNRFFYIASTKRPSITIETEIEKVEMFFRTLFRFKKKIPLIIDCIKNINNDIETNIDFYVDSLHSANMEIFYGAIPADTAEGIKYRKKIVFYILIVAVLWGIALWVVGGQIRVHS